MNQKTGTSPPLRLISRIALVQLDPKEAAILNDCFRQFHLETVDISDDPAARLHDEKFEGCVVSLDGSARPFLEAARNSPSSKGMVIYGLVTDPKQAMQYSSFGVNAVLNRPLERTSALRVVRATYLLAVHEFRRYVRIPVVVEVEMRADGINISGLSHEVSSGGMSLESRDLFVKSTSLEATFALPDAPRITLPSQICWRKEHVSQIGLRFDATDPNRRVVRDWIEKFLSV